MIGSLQISGFRGLRDFRMGNLRRVNLLVGKNNVGKTSALEALYLLANAGDPVALWRLLMRRGEQYSEQPIAGRGFQPEVEPRHLFFGHDIKGGAQLRISTFNGGDDRSIRLEVADADPAMISLPLFAQFSNEADSGVGQRHVLIISGQPNAFTSGPIPLNTRDAIRQDVMQIAAANFRNAQGARVASEYLTTDSLAIQEIQQVYNEISLSPREPLVVRAMQFVEPEIERIAAAPGIVLQGTGWPTRGGLKVKLRGNDEPIPIGSLGEGSWRILALAMSLTRAPNGLFLMDEIDTGLHFSTLPKVWRFVVDTAKEFNVQVFASTHSLDCVRALAALATDDSSVMSEISIQRIESRSSISYSEDELKALADSSRAAQEEIEVR
jgi:putative AbiEii toxin of type IV toxin-antitoxin system